MRRRPISRDEVRIRGFRVITLPADSVREREYAWGVEPIEALWQPLIAQLTKEQAEREASPGMHALREEQRKLFGSPTPPPRPPSIPYTRGWAKRCRRCEREFYQACGFFSRYCTDACSEAARAPARAARVAGMVKAKSEARANSRADRKCASCGQPIVAQRSTKQFCSTKCRMRSHRAVGTTPGS